MRELEIGDLVYAYCLHYITKQEFYETLYLLKIEQWMYLASSIQNAVETQKQIFDISLDEEREAA